MAIFSGLDLGLPILTQIAQVDPAKDAELIHLAAVADWQRDRHYAVPVFKTFDAALDTATQGLTESDSEEAELLELHDVCTVAAGIVTNLFDFRRVTAWQLRMMSYYDARFLNVFVQPPALAPEDALYEVILTTPLRRRLMYPTLVWNDFSSAVKVIVSFRDYASLSRCEECQNIFERDGTARFCSRRCIHRAGERRRYAEKRKHSDTDTGIGYGTLSPTT